MSFKEEPVPSVTESLLEHDGWSSITSTMVDLVVKSEVLSATSPATLELSQSTKLGTYFVEQRITLTTHQPPGTLKKNG